MSFPNSGTTLTQLIYRDFMHQRKTELGKHAEAWRNHSGVITHGEKFAFGRSVMPLVEVVDESRLQDISLRNASQLPSAYLVKTHEPESLDRYGADIGGIIWLRRGVIDNTAARHRYYTNKNLKPPAASMTLEKYIAHHTQLAQLASKHKLPLLCLSYEELLADDTAWQRLLKFLGPYSAYGVNPKSSGAVVLQPHNRSQCGQLELPHHLNDPPFDKVENWHSLGRILDRELQNVTPTHGVIHKVSPLSCGGNAAAETCRTLKRSGPPRDIIAELRSGDLSDRTDPSPRKGEPTSAGTPLPPWSDTALHMMWDGGGGQLARALGNWMQRWACGLPVHIVALGGSMTAGTSCAEGTITRQQCSWSARVARYMASVLPAANVTYSNLGRGATTSSSMVPGLAQLLRSNLVNEPAHVLVLVDYAVNDGAEALGRLNRSITSSTDPNLAMLQHAGGARAVSVAFERFVQILLNAVTDAAVVGVVTPCKECFKVAPLQTAVFRHYGIPMVDFTRAALAYEPGTRLWPFGVPNTYWDPHIRVSVHPPWEWHQHYANGIIHCLVHGTATHLGCSLDQQQSLWHADKLANFKSCDRPLSYFDSGLDASPPLNLCGEGSHGCMFTEDAPGKFGWVIQGVGAQMRTQLDFGAAPLLILTYLRSYEHVGTAQLRIGDGTHPINGSTDSHFSQQNSVFFLMYQRPFHVQPNSKRVPVELTLMDHDKFVLTRVISC